MKAAFISFAFGEYSVALASALARTDTVLLLLPALDAEPHLRRLSARVDFRPFQKPRMRQPFRQLGMLWSLHEQIRRFDPDVIHLQQGYLWFNLTLPLLRRYPLVVTVHDPRYHVGDRESRKTPQGITDFGFRQAAQLIVHSAQMQQLVNTECGIPSEILHVIPHVAHDAPCPQLTEEVNDEPQILFFGRIWEYKGLEYLIRAEPLISARFPKAKIVIAGEGEDFTRYRRMMVHPAQFIVHNEFVPHERAAELFQRASVVVLPYIEATQSGVAPMAYTFQKPVVATTVGGLPAQVEHGQTGLLAPPGDERALADAIISLLENDDLRRRLGAEGRRRAETEFAADAIAQQTREVYRCAMASNASRRRA